MDNATCIETGCDRSVKIKARGLCWPCYQRLYRAGELADITPRGTVTIPESYDGPVCVEDDCDRPVEFKQRGLCRRCYRRHVAAGTLGPLLKTKHEEPCSVDGCDKPAKVKGRCPLHAQRMQRHGHTEPTRVRPGCSIDGCDRPHHALGFCGLHHDRYTGASGLPMDAPIGKVSRDGVCEGPDCNRSILAKRLCKTHYAQQREGKPLTPIRAYAQKGAPCSADDCPIPASIEGMCRQHRVRFLAGEQDWDRPAKEHAPKGSGHTDKNGYRSIYVDGKKRLEHRVIAERVLGRPLDPNEDVHHADTNPGNNTTDGPFAMNADGRLQSGNLVIWRWQKGEEKRQWRGGDIGAQLEAARALLAQYGETL